MKKILLGLLMIHFTSCNNTNNSQQKEPLKGKNGNSRFNYKK